MELDTHKEDYKNRVRRLLQSFMDENSEDIRSWAEDIWGSDGQGDLVLDVDDLETFDFFVNKMYDKGWHAHDAYMFLRWSEDVDPRVPEDVGIIKMKEIEGRNNVKQPDGLGENKRNKMMKITKSRLKQIIKEERTKLIHSPSEPAWGAGLSQQNDNSSADSDTSIEAKVRLVATGLSNTFGSMMQQMAVDVPDMITSPGSWEDEVQEAQSYLEPALIAAIMSVLQAHEKDLHNGEYIR